MKVDREIDFHHYTVAQMRAELETIWSRREWHGLRRIRIVHGTGAALWKAVRSWADEKAIPWTTEPHNPGVTILHPSRRVLPQTAPPNRPIARLKRALTETTDDRRRTDEPVAPPQIENQKSKIENAPESELFAAELERLEEEDPRAIRQRKHSG